MRVLRSLALVGIAAASGCCAPRQLEDSTAALACRWGRVVALTAGAGNDTEAVWSPDGLRVACQTDVSGDWDIAVVDVKSGHRDVVVGGPGHACYPAWVPDGRLVYSFSKDQDTAMQAASRGSEEGYGLCLWDGKVSRPLTKGRWRDYTPCVGGDGAAFYFASTRETEENSATLWKLPLKAVAPAERVLRCEGASLGAVQPSLSPDGRYLVWAQLEGFRQNWRLCAARADNLEETVWLTPGEMSAYAPRWSPDGRLIAFAGFRAGDPGWGVFILEPRSGSMSRIDTGPGNSRSPAWSPDGRELVFENNRSGCYKLYRLPVFCRTHPERGTRSPVPVALPRLAARLERSGEDVSLVGPDGTRVKGKGFGAFAFERPVGLDFGSGPFYVKMTLVVDAAVQDARIAAVGRYAEHPQGWQVFVRQGGKLCFSSREPDGRYVGVESDEPVMSGKPVTVVGVRDADGTMRMSVNGAMQKSRASGATFSYGPALSVCLGQQWNGGMRFDGRIQAFECGWGTPAGVPRKLSREQLFAEERP